MGTNGHKTGYEAGKGALRRSKREVKIGQKSLMPTGSGRLGTSRDLCPNPLRKPIKWGFLREAQPGQRKLDFGLHKGD